MNVLLFNPPGPEGRAFIREGRCTQESGAWAVQWPPISLATAAAMLEADGRRVRVVDFPASGGDLSRLIAVLKDNRPEVAIWSTGTPSLTFDLSLAELVKKEAPGALTGVIGTHVTARPEEALGQPGLDAVIRGEPEGIIRNFCRIAGGQGAQDWRDVRGLSWRARSDGGIHHNEAEECLDPGQIPEPAWHCLDLRPYRLPLKGRPFLIVAPVRGCPFRCSFCTAPVYYGHRLRKRPVERVLGEIEANVARFGVREFFIWADTFTADLDYVRRFCRAILEKGVRITWTCNGRVDRIDGETLALMKAAGLWMISFGLESGDDGILARAGKQITVAQSRAAVAMAHDAGLRVAGHFILGLPGETEETLAKTLRLSLELPLDIAQFYAAAPFPGTPLFEEALREGWLKEDPPGSQSQAVMHLPGLPPKTVDRFRRLAYRQFYARPKTIMNIAGMMEWGAITSLIANGRRFLRWTK